MAGAPPLPPRPRIIPRERETIGDGEDISRSTDRQLLVRALNEIFSMQHTLGQLTAGVAEAKAAALDARALASRLESRVDGEMRERQASVPEMVEDAVEHRLAAEKIARLESERKQLVGVGVKDDDRKFQVRLAIITAVAATVVTGIGAFVVRLLEVSMRGHW